MAYKLVDDCVRLLVIVAFVLEEAIEFALSRSQEPDDDLAELTRRSPLLMQHRVPSASTSSLPLGLGQVNRKAMGRELYSGT
eukprot:751321-Hanusia_phi.AAC.4